MLRYAFESDKDDYELLQVFESEMHEGRETYTYLIRERHTNRLALLENCAILDMEFFTDEDFDACAQLVKDYTRDE